MELWHQVLVRKWKQFVNSFWQRSHLIRRSGNSKPLYRIQIIIFFSGIDNNHQNRYSTQMIRSFRLFPTHRKWFCMQIYYGSNEIHIHLVCVLFWPLSSQLFRGPYLIKRCYFYFSFELKMCRSSNPNSPSLSFKYSRSHSLSISMQKYRNVSTVVVVVVFSLLNFSLRVIYRRPEDQNQNIIKKVGHKFFTGKRTVATKWVDEISTADAWRTESHGLKEMR